MVASTVIITGRIRWMPASGSACSRGSPFSCISSMKVEEHDDVADDHADQAGDAQKGHKSKRRMHYREGDQRANHTIGSSGEYQKRFHGVIELNEERQINAK